MKTKLVLCAIVVAFIVLAAASIVKRSTYSDKHPIIDEIRRRFAVLNPKYGSIPIRIGRESFTEDKHAITLCIADPATKRIYDINTLMYVSLHELAHTITHADGENSHKDEFKANFAHLLRQASERGIYDPSQPIPDSYCGGPHHHS